MPAPTTSRRSPASRASCAAPRCAGSCAAPTTPTRSTPSSPTPPPAPPPEGSANRLLRRAEEAAPGSVYADRLDVVLAHRGEGGVAIGQHRELRAVRRVEG